MPLLLFFGPARNWWSEWPLFSVLVTAYMYACYFVTTRAGLPRLLLERRYGRLAWVSGGLVGLTYLLTLYPLPKLDFITPSMTEYQTQARDYNVALSVWLMFVVVLCFALTVALVKELYNRILLQNIAENRRNKAELAVFKAQISPHFLFNTLNSLYSLVIGTSQKAEDAFIKFTEILKYTYVTIENERVPAREEIAYIGNYIDLQLIRLDNHTSVSWDVETDDDTAMIPPMILLTFVENAFKYGSSTTTDCTIAISLSIKEGVLLFETSNRVLRHAGEFRREVPVGIENCRGRLAALYPGRHALVTEETDGIFRVSLKISL